MKRLKTFFYSFKNSAFKPNYYKDVIKAPFTFSLKYFLFLFLSLTLLTSITFSIFLVQKASPYINQLKTQIPHLYPPKLEIIIKDGQTAINMPEPFFIPLDPELFPKEIKQALNTQPLQNILVINTRANPSDIKDYQTLALLTKNDISFISDQNEIRIQSLEEVEDFTLNRQVVNQAWQKITPYFKWIIPLTIIILLIFLPTFTLAGKFIYLSLISLITLITARFFKLNQLNYKKALQINFHAITLPTVITAIFQLFGAPPKIPFFQTIILIIFNLIIFSSLKSEKSS